jgi:hypothetical protein
MSDFYKPQDAMSLWWLGDGCGPQPLPRVGDSTVQVIDVHM